MNAGIPAMAQYLTHREELLIPHSSRSAAEDGLTAFYHNQTSPDLPVFVYQGIEGHAIPPASGEIVNVDIGVPVKDQAQKQKQQLPNKGLCLC